MVLTLRRSLVVVLVVVKGTYRMAAAVDAIVRSFAKMAPLPAGAH